MADLRIATDEDDTVGLYYNDKTAQTCLINKGNTAAGPSNIDSPYFLNSSDNHCTVTSKEAESR